MRIMNGKKRLSHKLCGNIFFMANIDLRLEELFKFAMKTGNDFKITKSYGLITV